jgi:cytochrome P450
VLNLLVAAPLIRGINEYPKIFKPLGFFLFPKKVRQSRQYQENLVSERVEKRMNNESQRDRADFVDSMMRHKDDEDEISIKEMEMNMMMIVLAGSETTASLLSGVTYYLLKNRRCYDKVREEVRGKFKEEEEITFASVLECEYMLNVLEEGLRMYPPVPGVFPRETLSDMEIDGVSVPKGTHVGVHAWSAYRYEGNWKRAEEFVPERWGKDGREGEFKDDSKCSFLFCFSFDFRFYRCYHSLKY